MSERYGTFREWQADSVESPPRTMSTRRTLLQKRSQIPSRTDAGRIASIIIGGVTGLILGYLLFLHIENTRKHRVPTVPRGPKIEKRVFVRKLAGIRALSNREELIGHDVQVIRGTYRGQLGRIIGAFLAEIATERSQRYIGASGVFYSVDIGGTVLVGLNWDEILRIT